MANRRESLVVDKPLRKKNDMEDKNGDELKILSSRFKEKKERTKGNKLGSKKDEELKLEAEKLKKKTALEEVKHIL